MNKDLTKYISNILKKNITLDKSCIIVKTTSQELEKLLSFFKDHENCMFKTLIDIFVIDYPESKDRFLVSYLLLSLKYNIRARIEVSVDELTSIPSVSSIYKSACWMEREIWDMNGIFFDHHPDLRRILTDYSFEGYPLKKDFPLSGYTEVRYDDSQKRVVSELVEMSQDYRVFNFKSSWEV
uniref:NADH dehydrogenase subunit 9 n=1 Tax=Cryptomonas gyropyrenoidosa TaxID=233257 RepID=UPI0027A690C4|nr:NADH dehydrogenase subunit 9 [Cryptomonas gyropyrenoidosa]WFQ82694.1 NADH dehydrogenase subunit 9 [Cryptomonas gyropyrenoidosa]